MGAGFQCGPDVIGCAQIEGGTVLVLEEIAMRHASTQEACERFEKRFPNHARRVGDLWGRVGEQPAQYGRLGLPDCTASTFRTNYGARVTYKSAEGEPERAGADHADERQATLGGGEVRLLVDPKCKELIKDFEQVSYKADSNAIDKEKDRRRTHLSDALGYLLWQECRPQPADRRAAGSG